jgi:hypothetical protein
LSDSLLLSKSEAVLTLDSLAKEGSAFEIRVAKSRMRGDSAKKTSPVPKSRNGMGYDWPYSPHGISGSCLGCFLWRSAELTDIRKLLVA